MTCIGYISKEKTMTARKRSEVWLYFEQHEDISTKVMCQIYSEVPMHSGSTSYMLKHLKTKHASEYSDLESKKKKVLQVIFCKG